jgi:precorrin-2 dehydrogenase/sirohydrochlorin ferrochelatase
LEDNLLTQSRMVKVSDTYSLQDLCEMDEKDMSALLRFYPPGKVPRLGCLRAMTGEFDGFDGSFGFCVGWG